MVYERDAIRIDGLRELQRQLKLLDGESQKELRLVLNKAADIVVQSAQPLTPTLTGRARASIKAASGQREARVKAGGAKVPYFGFIDFGNKVDRGPGSVGRGDSHPRPFIKTGRIIYPAYKANQAEIEQVLQDGLTLLALSLGFEVHDGGA